jgi:hypothetical protein
LKGPPSARAATIESTAFEPTFLIAPRPKRMPDSPRSAPLFFSAVLWEAGSTGVNVQSEVFTSGGRTLMPISRHSLMYLTTFAVLPVSEVSNAAMNSIG